MNSDSLVRNDTRRNKEHIMDGLKAELASRMLNQAHIDPWSETYQILKKAEIIALFRMQPFFGDGDYEFPEINIRYLEKEKP